MSEVAYVLLGWLLGILSPIAIRHGERHRRKKEVASGLRAEFAELRVRVAMTSYLITLRHGNFDRAFLEWLTPFFDGYQGSWPATKILQTIQDMIGYTDEQLAAVAALGRAEENGSLSLKRNRLPYLEANLGSLDLFSERAKLLAVEIAAQSEIINEEVERVRFFYALTFDSSLSTENHEQVRQSVIEASLGVESLGRNLLGKLSEIDKVLEKT